MIASMAAFTFNDALIKTLSAHGNAFFQIIGMRGVVASIVLGGLAWWFGQLYPTLSPKTKKLLYLRSLADVLATFTYLFALFNMPLSGVISILQILPLSVTFAGAVFLKEKIGWQRSLAIVIGFIGVLLVIKPATDSYNTYSIFVFITVVAVTARDLIARKMPQQTPSLYVALSNAIAVTIFALLASSFNAWEPFTFQELSKLLIAALLLVGAYFFAVASMRVGSIAVVSPFRYSSILIALLLGYVFFNERPDFWALIGIILMVASGSFALYRKAEKDAIAIEQAPH